MINKLRTEPPLVLEFEMSAYSAYTAFVDPAATVEDFYRFITSPSPRRERFILSLSRTVHKADEHSVIERLHYNY
jgi:hypothetical protein